MTSPDAGAPAAGSPSLAETFLRPFMKLAAVQPGERVLALAAGSGEAAIEAVLRSGESGEVLVVDTDPRVPAAVAGRARALGLPPPRTALMDPARLDLPDGYWDVVICHFGLAEFEDPEQVVAEAQRVLRPVGRFAVSALGERERCPLVTIFLDTLGRHMPGAQAEAHRLFRYSWPGRLSHLLAERGFADAVPERLTEWVPFRDVDDYWQTLAATRWGRLADRLSPDAVADARTEIERRTRFYRRRDGIELKVEAVILAAVK